METEIQLKNNGYAHLLLGLVVIIGGGIFTAFSPFGIPFIIIGLIWLTGLFVIAPNQSRVLLFFGKYKGTVKQNGFFWLNPFYTKKKLSLRVRNMETEALKVNDSVGNPILISAIVVWRVSNTYSAVFDIESPQILTQGGNKTDYETGLTKFVKIQAEAALRKIAHQFPYDNTNDNPEEVTLRSGNIVINETLQEEMCERLAIAGIEVVETRLSNLSYAPEIAAVMLQRQQAQAIVAARTKIVEGSVGIVKMALQELETDLTIAPEQKAAMVGNLLMVLCAEKEATPVVSVNQ